MTSRGKKMLLLLAGRETEGNAEIRSRIESTMCTTNSTFSHLIKPTVMDLETEDASVTPLVNKSLDMDQTTANDLAESTKCSINSASNNLKKPTVMDLETEDALVSPLVNNFLDMNQTEKAAVTTANDLAESKCSINSASNNLMKPTVMDLETEDASVSPLVNKSLDMDQTDKYAINTTFNNVMKLTVINLETEHAFSTPIIINTHSEMDQTLEANNFAEQLCTDANIFDNGRDECYEQLNDVVLFNELDELLQTLPHNADISQDLIGEPTAIDGMAMETEEETGKKRDTDMEIEEEESLTSSDTLDRIERTRSKNPQSTRWKRSLNKKKRERGDEYKGIKRQPDGTWNYNVSRPSKQMKPCCNCRISLTSKLFYCKRLNENVRLQIFNRFWKEMNWQERRIYVSGLISIDIPKDTKNRHEKNTSRRVNTLRFFLNCNNMRVRVCKKMFLNTLGLTDSVILRWIKPEQNIILEQPMVVDRKNTKSRKTRTSIDDGKVTTLKTFFDQLPKLESHYCRKDTKKLYLEPIFQQKTEVYELYLNYCKEQNKAVASLKTFYVEFQNHNLSIFTPRKDQCDLCVAYKSGNISPDVYQQHVNDKDISRKEKEMDSKQSDCIVFTMDLQAVLLCPKLQASALYYKTKLIVHNFTVFNNKTHDGFCYTWHEGEGGITANEFSSIISYFIEEEVKPTENQVLTFWSDSCGYQNKNSTLANAFLYLTKKLKITIVQKFLTKGHTQMECDSIHAAIERKLKHKDIHVPADYIQIFKQARKNPRSYDVKYLDHTFFKNYSSLQFINSIRPGNKVGDPTVSQLKCLKYTQEGKIFYKLGFTEEWTEMEKRKSKRNNSLPVVCVEPLYRDPLKITNEKFKHLQEIKKVIPKDYHDFYGNLKH